MGKVGDMLVSKVDLRPLRKGTEYRISYITGCTGYIDIEYFDGTIPYRLVRYTKVQLVQLFEIKGTKN